MVRESGNGGMVYWRSRRGMLELDLLLVPFTREVYGSLGAPEQGRYRELLACEDQELFGWLLGGKPAGHWQPLIDRILAHKTASRS